MSEGPERGSAPALTGPLPIAGRVPDLPDAPALVCADGVVVDATPAAARLAGHPAPDALRGVAVDALLTGDAHDADLHTLAGRAVPVRIVRWPIPGSEVLLLVDVSDLASGVDTLRTERRRLAEVERVAGIGWWEFDPLTGETRWSPGHHEILGLPHGGAALGVDAVLDLVHPDDQHRVAHHWRDHIETGTPLDTEYRIVRPDGAVRTIHARARTQADRRGRLLRHTGSITDVTERVAELVTLRREVTQARTLGQELRAERRRIAEAQCVAGIGMWEWEPGTGAVTWSDVLRELFGVGEDAPASYPAYLSLVHPEDREWVDELWQQLAADAVPVECEHRVLLPDGSVRALRCYGALLDHPGLDDAPSARLVGTAQDVTEQRAAEARMARSSQRFADLVAITPVGIGILDDSDRLIDANEALCRLLGYELEQLRGMTAVDLTHPDERARRWGTRESAGAKSYTVPQRTLLRSDGEPVCCELHVSMSVQDDGQRFLLVVFADVTERRRAADALRYQATHDELTGLGNRAAARDLLAELLADPARDVAVLFCDIDNFKRVNDSLGHDAGDELLVALSRRLADGLPEGCTAARLSGDSYVVICADAAAHGGISSLVATVGGLLRTAVPVHGQLLRVSAAIGVAVPDETTTGPEDLLRFADAAVFAAKRQGAGRVAMANPALIASADRQVQLEGQLREALGADRLELHFQPVVGPDGSVLTAEALIRWPHPDRGMLAPDVFLPVAEQGDLMRELDRWVLRSALREARCWPAVRGRPVAVAVNLSGLVPGDPEFVDTVATVVAESGLPWDRVVLELVETSLANLPSRTRQSMAELVERGVRFAVDDFGTGYSSLARLKELPAQIVKLDRRFVSGVGVDPSDFAVARAVVDMARAMGRSCVAEGVETDTQFHVLRGLGVDAYQGWLFSRPVPPREFRAVLGLGPLYVPGADQGDDPITIRPRSME